MAWIWRSFLLKSDGCAEQEEKTMASREYLSLGEIANLVGLASIIALSGFSTLAIKRPDPITVSQVLEMSRDGVTADTIVQKMRNSDTVYRLSAAQLAKLHDQGVTDPVLNFMQRTYIEAERREQSSEDWSTGSVTPWS